MKNSEFAVGDQVRFNPYGVEHLCTVTDICPPSIYSEGLVEYELLRSDGVKTRASGLTIVESQHYEKYPSLVDAPASIRCLKNLEDKEMHLIAARFENGRRSECADEAKQMAEKHQHNGRVQFMTAAILDASGQRNSAMDYYRRAHSLGIAEAESRIDREFPLIEIMLRSPGARTAATHVLVCNKADLNDVSKKATRLRLEIADINPKRPEKEERFQVKDVFCADAKRIGLKRFLALPDAPSPTRGATKSPSL